MAQDGKAGARKAAGTSESVPPDLFTVRISVTRETFQDLLRKFDLDVGCRPHFDENADGSAALTAFATKERISELEAAGYNVEVGENASELGRQRQAEVGQGDRFEGGRVVPRGLGEKTDERGQGGSAQ